MSRDDGMKSPLLDGVLAVGVITVALTEGLSLFHGLNRATVCASWAVVVVMFLVRRGRCRWNPLTVDARLAVILGVTAVIAVISPPNGWDAVSYHMSRVMYWIQNGSVEHFPTHNLRQVIFSPFAEFCILQLQLIWGGDRLANLVQWGAFAGCLCAVAELVRRFGAGSAAVSAALVFAATLPMAILQATGTENDLVLALWLLIAVLAVEENLRSGTVVSALKVGAASGLLALTKGTGYILGAPVLVGWSLLLLARSARRSRALACLACAGLLALGLNAGHSWRNIGVFGHPLGDRVFIDYHQNEVRSFRVLASNLVRNVSFHVATPIPRLNDEIVRGIGALHSMLGLGVTDERTTLLHTPLSIGLSTHEDKTGNPFHFAAIVVLLGAVATRRLRLERRTLACIGISLTGFVLMSWFLKWQPWGSRFQLSLFFLMAVPCGIAAAQTMSPRALRWLSAVFLVACLPWLLANETRQVISVPAQRGRNIFLNSRAELYMAYPLDQILLTAGRPPRNWGMKASYLGAAEALERSGCRDVGLIQATDSWDYPLWALAWERGFVPRIRQIQIDNRTAVLSSGSLDALCAVITVDSPIGLPVPKLDVGLARREIYRAEPIAIFLIQSDRRR
jgi:hypothetical protein